jgi:hypothetical protein
VLWSVLWSVLVRVVFQDPTILVDCASLGQADREGKAERVGVPVTVIAGAAVRWLFQGVPGKKPNCSRPEKAIRELPLSTWLLIEE